MSVGAAPTPYQKWRNEAFPEAYRRWNLAIADYFFRPANSSRPVYLTIDQESLAEVAAMASLPADGAAENFVSVVRNVVRGDMGYQRVLGARLDEETTFPYQRALAQARCQEPPMFIGLLALTVLAASQMGADEEPGNAFYTHLKKLLPACPRARREFSRVVDGWKALNQWLDQTHGGRLGCSTARENSRLTLIGYPISQCALRWVDRQKLPDFYRWARYRPGHRVATEGLDAAFSHWARRPSSTLTRQGVKALGDPELHRHVVELVDTDLAAWDGESAGHSSRAAREAGPILQARLVYRPRRGPRPDEFRVAIAHASSGPAEVQIAGTLLRADPIARWYGPTLECPNPLEPTEWAIEGTERHARLAVGDVIVLTEDVEEARWCAVDRLSLGVTAIVLARQSCAGMVERFLEHAGAGEPQRLSNTPAGWVGFEQVELERAVPTDEPALECLSPLVMMQPALSGGLALGGGRWLYGAPPAVSLLLPEGYVAVELEVDGSTRLQLGSGDTLDLATLDLAAGPHHILIPAFQESIRFEFVAGASVIEVAESPTLGTRLAIHDGQLAPASVSEIATMVPTAGLVRILGAEVTASEEDLDDLTYTASPLELSPCSTRFVVIGRAAGEVLDLPGHRHFRFPPRPWDPCQAEFCTPPFRPQWVARRNRKGRWSIRLVGTGLPPRHGAGATSAEKLRAWAEALTRRYRHGPVGAAAELLDRYRKAALGAI